MTEETPIPSVAMKATCRTSGCSMDGVPVDVRAEQNPDGVYRVVCGACGQPITDLQQVA